MQAAVPCPFCEYDAGDAERCSECGLSIPDDPTGRRTLSEAVRGERRAWMLACVGWLVTGVCVWLYAELHLAIMNSYYPGTPMRSVIARMQMAIALLPEIGVAYAAWRMRRGVRDRRSNRWSGTGTMGSVWTPVAWFLAIVGWILPGLAMLAIAVGLTR